MTEPIYLLSFCLNEAEQEAAGVKPGVRFMSMLATAYAKGGNKTGFGQVKEDNGGFIAPDPARAIGWYQRMIGLDKVPENDKQRYRGLSDQLSAMLGGLNLDSDDEAPTAWSP